MSIYLCGNTGIKNRGCEAIIRSTVQVLNHYNGDITLASLNHDQDYEMSKELGINIIGYNQYPNRILRYCVGGVRKINKKSLAGMRIIEKPLFSLLQEEDVCLTIGGDTYCYSRPVVALALNRFTSENNIRNILWCCSIGRENLDNEKIEDLKRYNKIFAREIITYKTLIEAGVEKEKIVKVCDPAFFLNTKRIELPERFEVGKTIGINLSQMVINSSNAICYENILHLICYILEKTAYRICLIPHVYDTKSRDNDLEILDKFYKMIPSERIVLEDRELNCEELKYIISQCSFFIGARTHSTIAAYSTGVPTLVLGYSVKSVGIATDLFGTSDGYVIPYQGLKKNDEITKAFINIMERGDEIRSHLKEIVPIYRKELSDAIQEYINPLLKKKGLLCTQKMCTECETCVRCCPQHAISMRMDEFGFKHAYVDDSLCTNCQLCNRVCPVISRSPDSHNEPKALIMQNKKVEVLVKSSSGGIFFELAKAVQAQGGFVSGAIYNPQEKRIQHIVSNRFADIEKMMGSKYAQSSLGDTYTEIKRLLDKNNTVLFSGLPCQVEGLIRFLGKDYANLLCIDVICHGICSPSVFNTYLGCEEKKNNKSILDIKMRSKKKGWREYGISILFDDNSEFFEPACDNRYMKGYLNGLYTRESCFSCAFKKIHRESDITLGDAWGFEETEASNLGLSTVFIHSDKGQKMINELCDSFFIKRVEFRETMKKNKAYLQCAKYSSLQKPFCRYLSQSNDFYKAINHYLGSNYIAIVRRKLIKFKSWIG